jgi:hypothetical protein
MNYSEEKLKGALRRREPPGGFIERVLARIAAEEAAQSAPPRKSWLRFFTPSLVRWAAAAALAGALIAGGIQYRRVQREHAEGEAAKRQLILALRIAGSKLQLAKAKVNEINRNEGKNRQVKE